METKELIENLGKSFNAFKETNDKRLEEIEKKGHEVSETAAKLSKIEADVSTLASQKERIDTIEAAIGRGDFGDGGLADSQRDKALSEHRKGFDSFMRKGDEEGLGALEVNAALTTQSDPDGGYLVTPEIDTEISRILGTMSAMRMLASVRPVGSSVYKKIVNITGTSSGWVGEEEDRPETDTPSLKALDFPTMELYAEPRATQGMLDDAMFEVGGWLADEVSTEFTEQEGLAFVTGNGVNKPRGLLAYNIVDDASWSWGNLGYLASGVSGAFAASPNGGDVLVDLQQALKTGYRANANWLMNRSVVGAVRKLKDSDGAYLWKPGLEAGKPNTLLGEPQMTDDNMPDLAANSLSIAYGDFMRGYVITDRMGVRVLRDPYTSKPYVKFYTTKRVGGGVQNYQAIKLLKFGTS